MPIIRFNDTRAKNAISALWVVLGLEIVSIVSSMMQYSLLYKSSLGEEVPLAVANANDTREMIVGSVYTLVYVVCAVFFIQWFRRAYFNLHIKVKTLQFTEGWAAGAWFVPIVNLFRPYQIMKELYTETNNILNNESNVLKETLAVSTLNIWWSFWIITSILSRFVYSYTKQADTLDSFINLTILDLIVSLLGIPLALLAIKVVKDYNRFEPELRNLNNIESQISKSLIDSEN